MLLVSWNADQNAVPGRPGFRKILYVEQDYPDNYVDSTFLSDLQRNGESLQPVRRRRAGC